jgi:hypothetical protein
MPGVTVSTAVRSGPSGDGNIEAGQLFMCGETERGDIVDAKLVKTFSEFTTEYGGYAAGNIWPHAKAYFEEGGSRLYVGRVVGPSAVAGTLDIDDSSDAAVITLTANSPGAWSANLTANYVASDGGAAGSFRLRFTLDGIEILTSRDLVNKADGVAYINSNPALNSLMTAVAAGSSNDVAKPVVNVADAFASGADGTVTATEIVAGFNALFDADYGSGAVSAPGFTGPSTWNGLRDHADARNRIALCAFGASDAASVVKTAAADYYADAKAKSMAFYYPFVKVTDPADSGLTISISPEAYAAGARTKAIQEAGGPWRAGAGLVSVASGYVQDVVTSLDKEAGDLLDEARVNAIRVVGGGVRVYGARSVSNDEDNWRYITFQDTVNYVTVEAERRLEDFVFATIDSRGGLFNRIGASLTGLLDPIRVQGGFFEAFDADGERVDPGYSVVVSDEINPIAALAQGKVNAEVGIRVSSVGDQIKVTITKSNLTASVT